MDPLSITPANFTIVSASGPITGAVNLSANGKEASFILAAPLEYLTLYTATCTTGMHSATGLPLSADYSWTFTTESPADWIWPAPVAFDTGAPGVPYNYRALSVDLDDSANACVLWTQAEGAGYRVYASRSVEGGPWENPVALQPGADADFASTALVGLNGDGLVLAVWEVWDAGPAQLATIWFNVAGIAESWGPPAQVLTSPGTALNLLKLTVDAAGNALLFYYEEPIGFSTDDVYVVRYDAVNGWETPVALTIRSGRLPSIAADGGGTTVVVWKPPGSNPGIAARRFVPGSGWTAEETVDAPDADRPVEAPSVATDGAGNFLAAWQKRLPGGAGQDYEIFTGRFATLTGWIQGEAGPAASNLSSALPLPALSQDGSAMVTWKNNADDRCWASLQSSSGNWSTPVAIDLDSPNHQLSRSWPHFTIDGRVVVYGLERIYDPQGEFVNIWVNEFDPESGWESPALLRTAESDVYPVSEQDADGRTILFWLEKDGSDRFRMWWSWYR